jgi:hypothetical protein
VKDIISPLVIALIEVSIGHPFDTTGTTTTRKK